MLDWPRGRLNATATVAMEVVISGAKSKVRSNEALKR